MSRLYVYDMDYYLIFVYIIELENLINLNYKIQRKKFNKYLFHQFQLMTKIDHVRQIINIDHHLKKPYEQLLIDVSQDEQ